MRKLNNKLMLGVLFVAVLTVSFIVTNKNVNAAGTVVIEYAFANAKAGSAQGSINLKSDNSGNYDIFWADANGKLEEFDKISTVKLEKNKTVSYKFTKLNAIPTKATRIIALKDGSLEGEYSLPANKIITKSMSFTFGALSDIHLDGDGSDDSNSINDFRNELEYFKSKNVAVIANSGDITRDGRKCDIDAVKKEIESLNIPFYTARGNHDCYDACSSLSEWQKIEPNGIIFEKTVANETFVFLGLNSKDLSNPFTNEQITKLSEILKRNKNKRVFLFEHVFFGSVGNVNSLYPYDSLGNSGTAGKFKDLMKKYKNVISFTGHSHLHYELQKMNELANVCDNTGEYGYRVHIPSASRPRKNDKGTSSSDTYTYKEGALGYLAEVYDDCVVLTGRDFVNNVNLPYATYILYTDGSGVSTVNEQNNNVTNTTDSVNMQEESQNINNNTIVDNSNNSEIETTITSENNNISEINNSNTQSVYNSTNSNDIYTDIVIIIDKSMSYQDRFDRAKEDAKIYAQNAINAGAGKTRIALIEYGRQATVKTDFTSEAGIVLSRFNEIKLQEGVSGSNMHDGVCKAVEYLTFSKAHKKLLVIVSDGRTNRIVSDLDNHNRERSRKAVKEEIEKIKSTYTGIEVMTVGYCRKDDDASREFLNDIASTDANGNKMFYTK